MVTRKKVSIKDLMDANLVRTGDKWVIHHRTGRESTAKVTARGSLRIGGKEYFSPSEAASATLGGTPVNGWVMWKYDDGGVWCHVNALRKHSRIKRR